MCNENDFRLAKVHPRRPRGRQSGREKRREERLTAPESLKMGCVGHLKIIS